MRGRCDWRFRRCYSHLIWAGPDVLGSFLLNAGPFSNNVDLSGPLFSANVGPKPRMFSGRAVYVFRSLHLLLSDRLLAYLKVRQQGYCSALAFHLANALFQTACRFDELIQLIWSDCQRVGEEIVVLRIKGKGSVFQDVPVPGRLSQIR